MARSSSRRISFLISQATMTALTRAAVFRGTSPAVVAARIVRTVAHDDLFAAVLDDAEGSAAVEARWHEYET